MSEENEKNRYKNRHVSHKEDEPSDFTFPDTDNNLKRFVSVDEVLAEFEPTHYRGLDPEGKAFVKKKNTK